MPASKKNSINLNNSTALLEEDSQKTNDFEEDSFEDDDCLSDIDIPLYNKNNQFEALKDSKNNSLQNSVIEKVV